MLLCTSEIELARFKSELVNCCYQYGQAQTFNKTPITRRHIDSLKELRNRQDILMSRPDKGSGIVLMNRIDYVDKMNDILPDNNKFSHTANGKDRTAAAEQQVTNCLKRLKDNHSISERQY